MDHVPFWGNSMTSLLYQTLKKIPRDVSTSGNAVCIELQDVLLHKNPRNLICLSNGISLFKGTKILEKSYKPSLLRAD